MDPIRYGIIGRNFIVDMMLSAMAVVPEAAQPVAIYSRSLSDAEDFKAKNGLDFACDSLEQLGQYDGIDAVYIASPNCFHFDQAKFMLEHGKHILCEKPACSNAREVHELVDLARQKKLIFLEAMRPVFSNTMHTVRENLPRVGKLRQVRFDYCQPSSRLKFLREGKYINAFNPELSNAAIMDLGCYGIHALVHLFGKPESVTAKSIHLENGFEALGTVLMDYGEFTAEVSYSKIHLLDTPCTLNGEEGCIYLDLLNNTERIWLKRADGTVDDLDFKAAQPNDMSYELLAFQKFIREAKQPAQENENSILTADILDEARRQTGTLFPADLL